MARLPIPGADDGKWGEILNEYLSVSHDEAGLLRPGLLDKSAVGLSNVDNTADADKPISSAVQAALDTKAGTSGLATVATTGAYADLSGKPALATVATSGSYADLSNQPAIPTNNNQLINGAGYITDYSVTASDVSSAGAVMTTSDQTISGVKTFAQSTNNGAVRTRHLTVLPNPGRSTSASLFLDNENGQIWEFFANSGGSFGVYNGTSFVQPLSVLPQAPDGALVVDQYGAVVGGRLHMQGKITNLTSGTDPQDAVTKAQLDAPKYPTVSTVSGATATLSAANHATTIRYTNTAQVSVTLPTDASNDLPDGFWAMLFAEGAGGLTLSTAGITLTGTNPSVTIIQNEALFVIKTPVANTWMVIGGTQ